MSELSKTVIPAKAGNQMSGGFLPQRRFPEFRNSGEWEEKTLSQISSSIFDGTHQTPIYTDHGVPFFSVENIVSGKLNKFISKNDYLAATIKNKPSKGDVLITRIGKIGFSAVIDWDYDFSIYVTLAVVKKTEKFNSYYLHGFIQSDWYQREIFSKSLLNAVPCKINMDELRKTKVLLPRLPEQQKIADCLSSLDELIAAQAKKIDALKTHKKGLMQQLFPCEGETVPRLRFPEFRDSKEWEIKNLGDNDVSNFVKTRVPVNALALDSYVSTENILPDFGGIKDASKLPTSGSFTSYKPDDILIANIRPYLKKVWVSDRSGGASNDVIVVRPMKGVRNSFLSSLLKNEAFIDYVMLGAKGVKMPRGDVSLMKKYSVELPGPKEQQKIADCLSSLDELIVSQAEKLDALKTHKKGLMQQLFPKVDV